MGDYDTSPKPQTTEKKRRGKKSKNEKKGGCPRASGEDGDSRLGFSCPVFYHHLVFLFLKRGAFPHDATFWLPALVLPPRLALVIRKKY